MKNLNFAPKIALIAVVLAVILSLSTYAQTKKKDVTKNVPSVVLDAFKKAYPNAVIKGTGKENEEGKTFYEIESIDGKVKRDLLYLPDGKVAEIEEKIPNSDLPDAVKQSVKKEFPNGKIITAERVTRDGKENYELIVKVNKKSTEVVFDKDGSLIKKENKGTGKEKEEEDDKD
ncbi:MAG: PepSY-like domain-containing protein [Ignavibacteriales bacterium]